METASTADPGETLEKRARWGINKKCFNIKIPLLPGYICAGGKARQRMLGCSHIPQQFTHFEIFMEKRPFGNVKKETATRTTEPGLI